MKRAIKIIVLVVLIFIPVFGALLYDIILSPNTSFIEAQKTIRIPTGTNYEGLVSILGNENILKDLSSFTRTSQLMKYDQSRIKSGQYQILKNLNNRQIIQMFRSGKQIPVKMSFNNQRTIESLSGKIASYIEPDSLSLLKYFTAPATLKHYKVNKATILTLFIPNTYEVYWDTSPKELLLKLQYEQSKFWNAKNRRNLALKQDFSLVEVYTLASIVEKETQSNMEKTRIAGVYLNRLKIGMPLQADPTVVFALKEFDLKRILLKHLKVESPYNTYKYAGLPPGPIYMPSIKSIDAVLNPENHDFLYFCAKPDGTGQHAFATNLRSHNNNAKKYQRWLTRNKF